MCSVSMKFFVVLLVIVAAASALPSLPNLLPKLPTLTILPNQQGEERITNGQIADAGQFPYQVGLSLAIGTSNAWCGGTLISNRWILTAAHCTENADSVTAYLGAWDIQEKSEKTQQRIFSAKKNIIVHEDWSRATLQNDISLIKLPVEITFNDYIQPVTLPKKSGTYSSYAGEPSVASGWGKESDASTTVSRYLRFIEVPIMPEERCNRMYLGVVTEHMICIDTEGAKSTCNGDSGGPLVHKEGNDNILIGATSFGISLGCEKNWPGVFTRITSYVDWIEKNSGIVNL